MRKNREKALGRKRVRNGSGITGLGMVHSEAHNIQHAIGILKVGAGGNGEFNNRAGLSISQTQLATQFPGALSHASDADAHAVWSQCDNVLADSSAVISHRDRYPALELVESNPDFVRL